MKLSRAVREFGMNKSFQVANVRFLTWTGASHFIVIGPVYLSLIVQTVTFNVVIRRNEMRDSRLR